MVRVGVLYTTLIFLICIYLTYGVDRNKYKKCDESSFCLRHRSFTKGTLHYSIDSNSIKFNDGMLMGRISESLTNTGYTFQIIRYKDNIVRLKINEEVSPKARYDAAPDSILDTIEQVPFESFDEKNWMLKLDEQHVVQIDPKEVKFDFFIGGELAISANNRGLFYFEYTREKSVVSDSPNVEVNADAVPIEPAEIGRAQTLKQHVDYGINLDKAWESSFGGSTDRPKNGPQSIGMDISFMAHQIYGLAEHTTQFALKSTKGSNGYSEPYRLFNLDVFEYEIDTPMALYGAVPYVMSHQPNITTSVLWLNAAETWVDVEHQETSLTGYFGSLLGYSENSAHRIDTHWMSETGIIDIFFMLGPKPSDVWRQYASVTGTQEFPPLFSLAYHQCRWNYVDEKDVAEVNAKFEELDIPYDVIWLDIEHTNGKRYFTWDPKHFPTPLKMIDGIVKYGRKMVTIVDPHIKRDSGYHIHTLAEADGTYIKNEHGNAAYEGFCWPGSSSWIDYMSPSIRQWWVHRFEYSNYESTPEIYLWNDMNEPSVFSGPEGTIDRSAIHHGGWENRDVHNIYGMLMQRATSEALVARNPGHNKRSFVLSRTFFVGSQRWGAVWTGDNTADWNHLAAVQPMLLSLAVSGIPFSGADVGGFFGNPSPELLLRWYQVGAYQPFFRAHAHHDTKRREPWIHGDPWTGRIRNAIISRYSILPYIYTLFYESHLTGLPVLRPLWAEFPEDISTFTEQDTFLLGEAILVKLVTKEGIVSTEVSFPGTSNELWYDTETYHVYNGGQKVTISTPLDRIAVFQRGGTIVPRKTRLRRSSTQMHNDPYTFIVALDSNGNSKGKLYIDDGDSFDYRSGSYVYRKLNFTKEEKKMVLLSSVLGDGKMYVRNKVERIVVVGISKPTNVFCRPKDSDNLVSLHFEYDSSSRVLTVKNPDVIVSAGWRLEFNFET